MTELKSRYLGLHATVGGPFVCGACWRLRFSPIHFAIRRIGWCPGDKPPKWRI